jgi:hypothetical protein
VQLLGVTLGLTGLNAPRFFVAGLESYFSNRCCRNKNGQQKSQKVIAKKLWLCYNFMQFGRDNMRVLLTLQN